MEAHDTLHAMLSVGKKYSIDVSDLRALPLKLVVLSVKYVCNDTLWTRRFGESYVHWELVRTVGGSKNVLGGCAEWMGMLSFCKWEELSKAEQEIGASHPQLSLLRRNMRECALDTGDGSAWTLVCKLFLLMLVQGIPSLNALELLTCTQFKRDTHKGCIELLAKQAECLYTPAEYEATLGFVLDRCKVEVTRLEQTLALSKAATEDKKLSLTLSRMTVILGRPRLRDRVTSVLKTDERKAQASLDLGWQHVAPTLIRFFWGQVDTLLDTWESYTGFCYKHQFPPTLSERVKSRLYFLASQTRWDWRRHVGAVLPSSGALLDKVRAHPITQPDLPVILRVLENLSMDGSAPFQQMSGFQGACFQCFPVTHVQRMTLSQILQLYVAAYQPPAIWKEAWKHLVGVISVQIIRDVETFVSTHPFAELEVMRFVVAS